MGNLFSITSGLRRAGFSAEISNEPRDADLIVLPGVGAFSAVGEFMLKWKDTLEDLRNSGVKFLGVCLGMQIMFEEGNEGGKTRGLGWFPGVVDQIRGAPKLPHIGWDILRQRSSCMLTEGLEGRYAYFVHSYMAYTRFPPAMTSNYGVEFPALICSNDAVGTQFHPEKSGETGKVFFQNLVRWLRS